MLKLITHKKAASQLARQNYEDVEMRDATAIHQRPFFELPEIVFHVFHFVNRDELLCQASLVCKLWYDIAHHKQLWWHHTFIANPYYYENKKALKQPMTNQFFSPLHIDITRRQQASQQATTPSTPLTPVSPVAPVAAVNPKAQLFNYKHYFYEMKQQSSKKPHTEPPATILNCKDYFFETKLVKRFTKNDNDAASSEGQQQQQTPQSAPTPTSPQQESPGFLQRISSFGFLSGAFWDKSKSLFERDEPLEKKIQVSSQNVPPKRYRHTITSVSKGDRQYLYLIGGIRSTMFQQTPNEAEDEVWVLECMPYAPKNSANIPIGWRSIKVVGKPPHLGKHTAVAYQGPTDEAPKIFIFGGVENETVTNNLYVYDLQTNVWTLIDKGKTAPKPSPRTNHQAIVIGNIMYVVGGGLGSKMLPTNEVWALNLDTLDWTLLDIKNPDVFTPRLGFVMTRINKKLLIYGGGYWQQNSPFDRFWREKYTDLFIFDTDTLTFTKIDTSGTHPQTGTFPAHAMIGSHWFICGGAYDNEISNELYCLDTVTFQWKRVETKFYGGDSLAACHFVHQQQNRLLIYGGYCYHPLGTFEIYKLNYMDILENRGLEPLQTQVKRNRKTVSCLF